MHENYYLSFKVDLLELPNQIGQRVPELWSDIKKTEITSLQITWLPRSPFFPSYPFSPFCPVEPFLPCSPLFPVSPFSPLDPGEPDCFMFSDEPCLPTRTESCIILLLGDQAGLNTQNKTLIKYVFIRKISTERKGYRFLEGVLFQPEILVLMHFRTVKKL